MEQEDVVLLSSALVDAATKTGPIKGTRQKTVSWLVEVCPLYYILLLLL